MTPRLEPLPAEEGTLNIFGTLARHPDLLRRWLVFGSHVLGKSTLSARHREHRGPVHVEPLVETEAALADDRRPRRKANLAAVRVPGEHEGDAAALGLVEVVGVVREEQVRRPVGGRQALPVGGAEGAVIDATDDEVPALAAQHSRIVAESLDAD